MHCAEVKNVRCEDKDKCLPSWDIKASTPLMIRLPSREPWPYWLTVYSVTCLRLIFFFLFLKLWRNVPLSCLMFSVLTRYKLCWKPYFFRTVPQSYLTDCLLGYNPQFGLNSTLLFLLQIGNLLFTATRVSPVQISDKGSVSRIHKKFPTKSTGKKKM